VILARLDLDPVLSRFGPGQALVVDALRRVTAASEVIGVRADDITAAAPRAGRRIAG